MLDQGLPLLIQMIDWLGDESVEGLKDELLETIRFDPGCKVSGLRSREADC